MVTQLAREFGAYVIGTGRAADRQPALDFGANVRCWGYSGHGLMTL
jgi:NADPH:quinone reductase-like Zn-dependent oxidoreductase